MSQLQQATPGTYAPPTADEQRLALVRASLTRAERHQQRVRRIDARAVITSLATTATATLVAGIPAAAGVAPGSWRLTCAVTAALTAVGTVATGLRQQVAGSERLARAEACVGRLRAIEYGLSVGTLPAVDADRAYQEVVRDHAAILAE
ncbi:MAG TPA: hypothetical protein VFS08_19815 [Gemmatimonadaceae bacterium]|nr:hypothetical protein [Gemmatimonadaceae bacterium]